MKIRYGWSLVLLAAVVAGTGCVGVPVSKNRFSSQTMETPRARPPAPPPNVLFLNHAEGAWADVYVFPGHRQIFGSAGVMNLDLTLREQPVGFLRLGPSRARYNLGPYRKRAYIEPGHRYTFVYHVYRRMCVQDYGLSYQHVLLNPERPQAVDVDDGPGRRSDRYYVLAVGHIQGGGQPATLMQCLAPTITVDLNELSNMIVDAIGRVVFIAY